MAICQWCKGFFSSNAGFRKRDEHWCCPACLAVLDPVYGDEVTFLTTDGFSRTGLFIAGRFTLMRNVVPVATSFSAVYNYARSAVQWAKTCYCKRTVAVAIAAARRKDFPDPNDGPPFLYGVDDSVDSFSILCRTHAPVRRIENWYYVSNGCSNRWVEEQRIAEVMARCSDSDRYEVDL